MLQDHDSKRLVDMRLEDFAHRTASEAPAPGGGSVAAYTAALGAALGTMVANLSAHKRGWDERWEFFSDWAVKGERYKQKLLMLVDEDTNAFNAIMEAFRMPKKTGAEKQARAQAIQKATLHATLIPLEVMQTAYNALEVPGAMAEHGLPASISDAAVGAMSLLTGLQGAYYNVRINATQLKDKDKATEILEKAQKLLDQAKERTEAVLQKVDEKMN